MFERQFPRASRYNKEWVTASVSGAANPLWLTEWLATAMELRPGMRVLDLGCGRAVSSIFLAREFGAEVWATDLWFDASENLRRVRDAGMEGRVFPIRANARALPYAAEFFDAVIAIDCFFYFGTDDLYLNYLARFLRPAGQVGIAGSGLVKEFDGAIPEALQAWWTADMNCLHSADWWRRHWERSGLVDVSTADEMEDGWRVWLEWHRVIAPENKLEIKALEADKGRNLSYVRAVARRRAGVEPPEVVEAIPSSYVTKDLLA